MSDGIFNNGIQQPVQFIKANEPFDWLAYKAQVAAKMLPPIYEKVVKEQTPRNGIRSASDVAIDETINIAVDMAERLEQRLKGHK